MECNCNNNNNRAVIPWVRGNRLPLVICVYEDVVTQEGEGSLVHNKMERVPYEIQAADTVTVVMKSGFRQVEMPFTTEGNKVLVTDNGELAAGTYTVEVTIVRGDGARGRWQETRQVRVYENTSDAQLGEMYAIEADLFFWAKGDTGNGIADITSNPDDTLTITMTDGTTYTTQAMKGDKGDKGDQGEKGTSIVSFDVTGQTDTSVIYTVTFSDDTTEEVAVPKGPQGDTGLTGNGIASTTLNSDYTLTIAYTDGTTYTTPSIRGAQGVQGVSIIAFTQTGETATNTLYNVVFSDGRTQSVAIPKGVKGDKGDTGNPGSQGAQGPKGDTVTATDYTLYNVQGSDSQGAMSQDATTKAISAQTGYYTCGTISGTAEKVVTVESGNLYKRTLGGHFKVQMTNKNTAASGVTLQIGSETAAALWYNGAAASANNSWEEGEVLSVYYDGTYYQASNAQGGGGVLDKNISINSGDNDHIVDICDDNGNLLFWIGSDFVFHAVGNTSEESSDSEMPSKGLVSTMIAEAIATDSELILREGRTDHILDVCDIHGHLLFYIDKDMALHAVSSAAKLCLPSTINTYVGDTLQIFYYPTLLSPNYKHLGVNMFVAGEALNCKSLTRYAEYTPTSAGTKTMKFNVLDDSLGILASKTVPLNVITPESPSSMKNILLVGDSETEGYVNNSRVSPSADGMTKSMRYPYAKELMRILTSSDAASPTAPAGLGLTNIQLIGHLRGDIRHEGYGGRSASWFLGTSSPFYVNGAIDFNTYLAQDTIYSDTSKKGVDYIYILLGANNGVAESVVGGKLVLDATTYKNGMISLLDKIKSQIIEGSGTYANPNLKVILLSYAISNPTSGAYHVLGQGEYGNGMKFALAYYQYYLVNNELAAMSDYSDFVESVFVSHEIDSENGYAYINKQVNAYMADTEKEYIENVHPNTIGYKMYGHAVARDILSRI